MQFSNVIYKWSCQTHMYLSHCDGKRTPFQINCNNHLKKRLHFFGIEKRGKINTIYWHSEKRMQSNKSNDFNQCNYNYTMKQTAEKRNNINETQARGSILFAFPSQRKTTERLINDRSHFALYKFAYLCAMLANCVLFFCTKRRQNGNCISFSSTPINFRIIPFKLNRKW